MKLEQISENTYYIPGAINIGVIRVKNDAVLIDTGLDREAGRRILRLLEKNNLKVKAIINTHSHADHFGGDRYIVRRTNAKVYAPEIEAGIIQYPFLEPLYLYSAHPVKDLMNRFLMAEATKVDFVLNVKNKTELDFGGEFPIVDVLPLPGHSPNQIGVEVDNVLYCADSVFSRKVIKKYKIPLFMDVERQKQTLSFLEKSEYEHYVPCHAETTNDISELVESNLDVIRKVEEFLISLKEGTTEDILRKLCQEFEIKLNNFTEYYLMMSALRAYLSYLYNEGLLAANFDEVLYWKVTRLDKVG
jgi:glyoxylase-like metal-dependent hydrolase (beta-lactamase superfamily II)